MDDYDIMMNNLDMMYCCSTKLKENYNNILVCLVNDIKSNISIYMHRIENSDDIYLKVFNSTGADNPTKCCRLKMFKNKYKDKPDDDHMEDFVLTDDQKKIIVELLKTPFDYGLHEEEIYTPWEYAIRLYMHFGYNKKVRRLFNKYKNKIPDYTKL